MNPFSTQSLPYRMTLAVKDYIASDLSYIGAFGFEAVVFEAYFLTNLVKKSLFYGSHIISFLSVHFVILLRYGLISR